MYRYYSTQRPFGPGTYPKKDGCETIVNFDVPTYCEEIGREAWGYIDYKNPLTEEEASNYELTAGKPNCAGCVYETARRDMDCCWDCNRNPRRRSKDLYKSRRLYANEIEEEEDK